MDMKKFLLTLTVCTALFCLIACGDEACETSAEQPVEPQIIEFAIQETAAGELTFQTPLTPVRVPPVFSGVPAVTPVPTPTATPKLPLTGIVIGLDPGHQLVPNNKHEPVAPGSNKTKQKVASGAIGTHSRVREYQVNLDVSLMLRDILVANGATVFMTHEVADVDISNAERAQFFNEHAVDLGIRIHCNSNNNTKLSGAFMIVPSETRTEWFEQSSLAAQYIIEDYCVLTGLPMCYEQGYIKRSDQSGFNWCNRPICTIEMGFMTNPDDDAKITNPDFQMLMAQGLANGIIRYFSDYPIPEAPGTAPEQLPGLGMEAVPVPPASVTPCPDDGLIIPGSAGNTPSPVL